MTTVDAQTWTDLQLLLGRYCDACDRFDIDDFMSCWSQAPTLAVDPAIGEPVVGRENLRRWIDETVFPMNRALRMRHFTTACHVAAATTDAAQLRVGLLMTQVSADGTTTILRTLLYEDRVVREEGQWLFQIRRQTRDRPASDAPGAQK